MRRRDPERRNRKRRWVGLGAAALAVALALAPAAAAQAHDYLVSSTPKADSTVSTALPSVRLTFDAAVLALSRTANVVTVTDGAGRHFETGCVQVADADLTVPVALGASGRYTVTWRIVSADGHRVRSSLGFDYRRPAGATAARGTSGIAACGTIDGGAAENPNAAVPTGLIVALAAVGALVLAALIAVAVVLRRVLRAPPDDPAEAGVGADQRSAE